MTKLDLIGRKILHELDKNARQPTTKIAKKLRQSREKINYRINMLMEKGVIRKFVTMIDPAKLGYSIYKMYFQFQNLTKEKEKEMIDYLIKNEYVYWIATCKGKWDLNITVFARNINHFDQILSEFIKRYGAYILTQEFNTTLRVGICGKDWLLPEEKTSNVVYVGGENIDLKIDKIDAEILKILANNARMNAMEIGKRLNISQRVVIYRIKELEKKKIILGYTTSLDLELLERQFFKAIIFFKTMDEMTKNKVIQYCRSNPNISFFVLCVGSWPLELELIVKDNTEFYRIMDDFKEHFPEIKGYESIILQKEHKFDWMPLCYRPEK